MNIKKQTRMRRALKVRSKIRLACVARLCVYRSSQHIYAQLIASTGDKVLASASTLEKLVDEKLNHRGNIKAAAVIGKLIAKRAIEAGIDKVAFDRSGFHYHGRIKALADSAREAGLKF